MSEKQFEEYVLTVMFIQIALDTHDLVKNADEDMPHKQRQLTVLAGDFYSGLYYKTLSDLNDIQLIKKMAEGIKIVNENKIRIYNKELSEFNSYMKSMQLKESAIYQKLAEYFQNPLSKLLSSIWLHTNHILKEKELYVNYIVENNILDGADRKIEQINTMIHHYVERLNGQLLAKVGEKISIHDFFYISSLHTGEKDFTSSTMKIVR